MQDNKTSEALEFLLNQRSSSPDAGVMMAKKETFKAIADKYKKMEEALKMWTDNSECYDERDYCGECTHCKACDSLSFDPLG